MAKNKSLATFAIEDQLVGEDEFARLLRRSAEALIEDVRCARIFCVEKSGERRYPAFFADASYRRSDLYKVSRRLRGLPGGSKHKFFVRPKGSLGGITPLEALRRGAQARVLRAAEGFAER